MSNKDSLNSPNKHLCNLQKPAPSEPEAKAKKAAVKVKQNKTHTYTHTHTRAINLQLTNAGGCKFLTACLCASKLWLLRPEGSFIIFLLKQTLSTDVFMKIFETAAKLLA